MKRTASVIAILNWAMMCCLGITMLLYGNKPGAMPPVMILFFLYSLVSPVVALVGTLLGLAILIKQKETWKPFLFNISYLVIGTGWVAFLFINGQSV